MSATRSQELRQVLGFARAARERLRSGKLADAARYHGYAVRALGFVLGAQSTRRDAVLALNCSGRLHRVVAELGLRIETAVREGLAPSPPVDLTDLVDEIAAGLDVLRTRDGVDLDQEVTKERARNIACRLLARFEIARIEESATSATDTNSGNDGGSGGSLNQIGQPGQKN